MASAVYLYVASIGLDGKRRAVLAVGGASLSLILGGLVFATASNICADGAHLRSDPWVLPIGALFWFSALVGLGLVAHVRTPYVWVGPLLGLIVAIAAGSAESIIGLHTMSRYCDGLPDALRLHTVVAVALPALVAAAGVVASTNTEP